MSTRPEVGRRRPELEDSLGQFVRAFLRKKVTAVWTNRAALPLPVADRDHLLITLSLGCRDSEQVVFCDPGANQGSTMAKRKKQSAKVQKRKGAKARPKAKKLSKATRGKAAAKRAVARAKPKRAPMKKAALPVAPSETVAVEVIEQPAPGVITVTEVEETELRQAS